MKQLLFPLLFLPCIAMAQYPGNAGQKITLGEQTTADGLVYRGLAADTTRKPSVDTMAYILLDTNTNIIWQYKKATSNAWTRVGGSISSGVTGVLPVANGGTGATTLAGANIVTGTGTTNYIPKFTSSSAIGNSVIYESSSNIGIGNTSPTEKLSVNGNVTSSERYIVTSTTSAGTSDISLGSYVGGAFINTPSGTRAYLAVGGSAAIGYSSSEIISYSGGSEQMRLTSTGLGIGTASPSTQLHTTGGVRFANFGAGTATFDASGNISSSDSRLKKQDFSYKVEGLKEILQLKPIAFKLLTDINERGDQAETQIGFFADDVAQILPSASFVGNNGYYNYLDRAILAAVVKAMQEQQAIIEQLKTRILTLENK